MLPNPFFILLLVVAPSLTLAQHINVDDFHERRMEAAANRLNAGVNKLNFYPGAGGQKPDLKKTTLTFSNPKASEFWVNGATIPEVDFDIGDSWAGLMPISSDPNETRKLFFWFFPPGPEGSLDDLIFWTNGGPGCSSLEILLRGHGPFLWETGADKPIVNANSWTNLSSILYVEQPVGTGYSQGQPNIKNQDELAAQFVGFFQQFLEVFSELKGKKLWLSGESYAGMYVPYIANYIYEHPDLLDLSPQGIWLANSLIGSAVLQIQIPAVSFVRKYNRLFSFTPALLSQLDQLAHTCNYAGYFEKWTTYPPSKGPFPSPSENIESRAECNLAHLIMNIALNIDPTFNPYSVYDPASWDVVRGIEPHSVSQTYFNRADVKKAIHAPSDAVWNLCSKVDVFPERDSSPPSAFSVLPNVIEKSKRSVIVHGLGDFVLISEGTRMVIQNMTWGGQQGFQTPIPQNNFFVNNIPVGHRHDERGLTYVELPLSGHQVPRYAPVAAYQSMQEMMGFRYLPDGSIFRDEL